MSRTRDRARPPILRIASSRDDVGRGYVRRRSPPSYLRLVYSARASGGEAASRSLPVGWGTTTLTDLMSRLTECANQAADRAVDALRRETTAYGLELGPQALAAIRDAVLGPLAAGIRARIVRAARERDLDPDEDTLGDDFDDPYPYTGVGLRERLRAILEPDDEPA